MIKEFFIPFNDYKSVGGVSSFMHNLKNYLDKSGFVYTEDSKDVKHIFFPVEYNTEILRRIKERGGKIIQRLDGIYYEPEHTPEQLDFNQKIKEIYLRYADFVIFQSEYSKKQCFEKLGNILKNKYTLIVNGVDKSIFFPNINKTQLGHKIKFVTTGNFRRREMLEPLVLALDELKEKYTFELNIVGPVQQNLKAMLNKDYVIYHGSRELKEVGEILNTCDIFLFSFLNPPCPNSVIEAVSSGLPVVSFNSGSMPELVGFNKELLAYVSDEIFQKHDDFNYKKLKEKIELCINKFQEFKTNAVNNCHLFSFEDCGQQYVDVFNSLQKSHFLKTTLT